MTWKYLIIYLRSTMSISQLKLFTGIFERFDKQLSETYDVEKMTLTCRVDEQFMDDFKHVVRRYQSYIINIEIDEDGCD